MILHLAFQIVIDKKKLLSVNDTTDHTSAPQHSMYELGNVIPRIIWSLARAPDTGVPILFSKIDLKDGYWRMVVNEHEAWNFAYVLPTNNINDPIQLVIPNALQMGWSASPAFFCAATETARDIAEQYYAEEPNIQPHSQEKTIMNIDWTAIPTTNFTNSYNNEDHYMKATKQHLVPNAIVDDNDAKLFHLLESYIDDFIALIQTTDEKELLRLTRY